MQQEVWVSFCISTYQRPLILKNQITSLLDQAHPNFNIIVSDNDPEASGKDIIESINDNRVNYFHNGNNFGMVKSFNLSIERATTEFIVMVTDDDPINKDFLKDFHEIYLSNPGFSLYGGFIRKNSGAGAMEIVSSNDFINEILDPKKTPGILWSSCILNRNDVLRIGKIPDYGSPHLMDHALIGMVGSINGGIIVNKMYSTLSVHDTNFSKTNFDLYKKGCLGFYETMISFCKKNNISLNKSNVVVRHLGTWLISNVFYLKKYFSIKSKDIKKIIEIDRCAKEILELEFMKSVRSWYAIKNLIFNIKMKMGFLK